LRIGRSNFRLLSEIASKESTLQLVYDVLRLSPFFKYQNTQQFGALLPIELTNEDIRNSNAYKEYYAVATRATPPKPKASVRKTKSSSDTTVTPPTATAGPRLVPDVPTNESEEEISWNSTDEEGEDDEGKDGDGNDEGNDGDDDEEGDDDDDEGNEDDDDEQDDDEYDDQEEEKRDEKSFDPILKTPENTDNEGNGEENLGTNVGREEGHDEKEDELYSDVNINLGRGIQTTQEFEDLHVTLTLVNPNGQQQSSSVSSQFVTSMLNPTPDAGMESIFKTTSQMDVQTPTLVAPLPIIIQRYMDRQMNEAIKVAVQIQSDRLCDEAQVENDEFLKTIDENMQKIIKEQVKEQVKTSYVVAVDLFEMELKKILIEKIEGNKSIHRSNEQKNLYKALVEAYESDKIIIDTYGDTVTLKRRRDDDADKDEEPSAGSDRGDNRRREGKEPESTSASEAATTEEPMQTTFEMEEPSHPEFETGADDQPIVEPYQHPELFSQHKKPPTPDHFSNFLMNRLKVDTLTLKLLAGPTYELMKRSCKSLVELEFLLEEVYKATTNQLDWVNPKGQQYPHNLLKPLPLIPNSRGRRVIPFDHFINNDFEYLRGGASSRKYTTSITKTKAADYGHIMWIEDLANKSSSMSSQFVTSMLNLTLDVGMESILETTSRMDVLTPTSVAPFPMTAPTVTPSTIATITTTSQAPILPTTVPSTIIQNLLNFGSLFRFIDRLRQLKWPFKYSLTVFYDEAQRENEEFLKTVDENMQKIIKKQVKEQVKVQVSKILPRIEQAVNEQLEAKVLTRSSHSSKTSYRRRDDDDDKDKEPSIEPDRGSKRRREGKELESASDLTETATRSAGRSTQGSRSRQALVDTLTLELLAGPTYELMNGSCKSLVELEYHLEEVFKATTDQLDWINLEGQQYLHNLLKPLPLIPNNRGRRVIPFVHFINNDLEYLRRGTSSRKYTTSITKSKAADYGHIKWIKDLVPRTMWIEEPIGYDKHALWRVSHWGRKQACGRPSTGCRKLPEEAQPNDGTLTDVRTALDDHLKGIRMQYLPQSILRKSDKDRAAAMI
nr:hypothetical protein [Tanacetum cinerariifolium]